VGISYSVQENEIRKEKIEGKQNKKRWEKNRAKWEKEPRLIAGVLKAFLKN
jgi:hypothetical protein